MSRPSATIRCAEVEYEHERWRLCYQMAGTGSQEVAYLPRTPDWSELGSSASPGQLADAVLCHALGRRGPVLRGAVTVYRGAVPTHVIMLDSEARSATPVALADPARGAA